VDGVEAEGRTVSEATERGLALLGLTREEAVVEVLSEGRPRLLGFGGEPARVRVTPIPDLAAPPIEEEAPEIEEIPPELRGPAPVEGKPGDLEAALEVLSTLFGHLGVEASITAREPKTPGDGVGMIQSVLDVEGDDLGVLIGRRGSTLASLQYVLNLIVSRKTGHRVAFGIDVDGYRRRREEALTSLARRMADRVRGTGRSVTLEPMPPNERRIVHLALANDPAVMTVSIGEGEARKVAITPSR
jgi:spoIIIJ-associated protein